MTETKHRRLNLERARRLDVLLAALARRSGDAMLGSVQFVDLSKVTDTLDEATLDRLADISIAVLTEHIVDPNIFYQQDSFRFAAVFVKAQQGTARETMESCSREILARLGEQGQRFEAEIVVEEVNARRLLALSRAHLVKIAEAAVHDELSRQVMLRPGESLDLRFRPFWRPAQGVFGPYLMSAKRTYPDGRSDFGYSILPSRKDLRRVAAYDLALLKFAAAEVRRGLAEGQDYGVVCPVFYPSFADPHLGATTWRSCTALPMACALECRCRSSGSKGASRGARSLSP